MRVEPLRFRFVMLAAALTSVARTWGVVFYGLLTHPVNASRIFGAVNPRWAFAALALAGVAAALSVVSLMRRDVIGLVGLICSVSVLSGIWARLVPVV